MKIVAILGVMAMLVVPSCKSKTEHPQSQPSSQPTAAIIDNKPLATSVTAGDDKPKATTTQATHQTTQPSSKNYSIVLKFRQQSHWLDSQDLQFKSTIELIKGLKNVNLEADWPTLEEAGVTETTSVIVPFGGRSMSLNDALQAVLDALHAKKPLGFAIVEKGLTGEHDAVVISTKEALGKMKNAYWLSSMPADAIVEASNAFATDLYSKLVVGKRGNVFFSPAGIETALAMVYEGTGGNTAKEMAKTLHLTLPREQLSSGYADLLNVLNNPAQIRVQGPDQTLNLNPVPPRPAPPRIPRTGPMNPRPAPNNPAQVRLPGPIGDPIPAYELIVANALWCQKGYQFKPEFTQLIQQSYGGELNQADFGQGEQARNTVNEWVAQRTKDKIKDLIPQGTLDEQARIVLTSAAYFKSKWDDTVSKFDKDNTKDGPFTVAAAKTVDVPMMNRLGRFGYVEDADFELLDLPYAGHELSMVILLPTKSDGLPALEEKLGSKNIDNWLKNERSVWLDVTVPKFEFSSEVMLADVLKAMGMKDAFDGGKAEFAGMTDRQSVFLSAVIHKASVTVDENGTQAAGIERLLESSKVRPPSMRIFNANHPFVFMIRHNSTGEILFMGRVTNPKEN
jgi:serpin B